MNLSMTKVLKYLFTMVALFVLALSVPAQVKKRDTSDTRKNSFLRVSDTDRNKAKDNTESNGIQNEVPINFPQGKEGHGMFIFDPVSTKRGYANFLFNDPKTYTIENGNILSYAGAMGFNKYYYFTYGESAWGEILVSTLESYDLSSGQISTVTPLNQYAVFLMGLTFDYSKNTLYAVKSKYAGTDLVKYDLKKKEYSEVGSFGNIQMLTLGATFKGMLYGISSAGWLYRINKENASLELIGHTQFKPSYVQSMDFDHTDETLYWASYSDDEGALRQVDINSGTTRKIGTLGNNSQVTGLYIPFTLPSVDVPDTPEDMSRVSGDNESKIVTLSWKNPAKDFGGAILTSLVKTEIYRNDELVYTLNSPVAGKQEQWRDVNVIEGYTTYKIISTNLTGAGIPGKLTVYVGKDVPGAVEKVVAVRKNEKGIISWQAPLYGDKGGQYDPSSTFYRVTRCPDGKVLTSNCTTTTIEDTEKMPGLNRYYYLVQALNKNGDGGYAFSNEINLGTPESVPFSSTFDTQTDFDRWMAVDKNCDGSTWKWIGGEIKDPEEKDIQAAGYWFTINNSAPDDWLVSPPITFNQMESYKLTFDMRASLPEFPERTKIYMGKTPVIGEMTEIGDFTVSDTAGFKNFRLMMPKITESGEYYIAFRAFSDPGMYVLEMKNVVIVKNIASTIEGMITGNGQPVPGAEIKIRGDKEERLFVSDKAGHYHIDYIEPGQYILDITKHGFHQAEKRVTINESEKLLLDVSLDAIPTFVVTGQVTDTDGKAVSGASIYIKGYDRYSVKSSSDGKFELNGIFKTGQYMLMVMKTGYELITRTVPSTESSLNLGQFKLEIKKLPPLSAETEEKGTVMNISWQNPVDSDWLYYDNGVDKGMVGVQTENQSLDTKAVSGTVYRTPAILTGMSFFLPNQGDPKDLVRAYVFDLDDEGNPVTKPLYRSDPMSCEEKVWTTFTFPEPIDAPNGFMIAVGYPGSLVLVCRDESKEIPLRSQCFAQNYEKGDFFYMEAGDVSGRMMMRAQGALFELPKVAGIPGITGTLRSSGQKKTIVDRNLESVSGDAEPSGIKAPKAAEMTYSYIVSRLNARDQNDPGKWSVLTPDKITDTTFKDETWGTLSQGIYRYAIQAVYKNGNKSSILFTDSLYSKMSATISIKVEGSGQQSLKDAAVTLTGIDVSQSYSLTTNEQGKADFTLKKGKYRLTVSLLGFDLFGPENIDLSVNDRYDPKVCVLIKSLIPVRDLTAEAGEKASEWNLFWNMPDIKDDFESHADFTINSTGSAGWQYVDGDAARTTALSGFNFPNAGSPMAFIVFNPGKTEPVMSLNENSAIPHSGEKYLASLAAMGSDIHNDDYLISPLLRYSNPFTLSFWAKTYNKKFGNEVIRVGYSSSGIDKQDFVWLKNYIELPNVWTEYRFNVPSEARHVTVNCVSSDKYMMMLDDVFIGRSDNTTSVLADRYEVYLDGKLHGTSSATTYKLTEVSAGKHTVGVKAIYDSGESQIVSMDLSDGSGIEMNEGTNECRLYPSPASGRIYIDGSYKEVYFYHASGKLQGIYQDVVSIPLSGWEKGIYLVRIVNADKVTMKKIEVI